MTSDEINEVDLDEDAAELATRFAEAKTAIAEWKEIEAKTRAELLAIIGDANAANVNGKRAVTIIRSRPRRFDKAAFAEDHPDLFERYAVAPDQDEIRVQVARGFGRSPL